VCGSETCVSEWLFVWVSFVWVSCVCRCVSVWWRIKVSVALDRFVSAPLSCLWGHLGGFCAIIYDGAACCCVYVVSLVVVGSELVEIWSILCIGTIAIELR
jgi:hypothetical protein